MAGSKSPFSGNSRKTSFGGLQRLLYGKPLFCARHLFLQIAIDYQFNRQYHDGDRKIMTKHTVLHLILFSENYQIQKCIDDKIDRRCVGGGVR